MSLESDKMTCALFLCNTFLISEQRYCSSPQETTSFQHLNESVPEAVEVGYDGAGAVLGRLHSGAAALLAHHGGRRRRRPRLLLLPSLPLRLLFPLSSLYPRRYSKPNSRSLLFFVFSIELVFGCWESGEKYTRKFGLAWILLNWEDDVEIL